MIISPDSYRYIYDDSTGELVYSFEPEREPKVWGSAYTAFIANLPLVESASVLVGIPGSGKSTWAHKQVGNHLFFDATNTTPKDRRVLVALARAAGTRTQAILFDTPLDVCVARNTQRRSDRVVPSSVLSSMHARLIEPSLNEGFAKITIVRP